MTLTKPPPGFGPFDSPPAPDAATQTRVPRCYGTSVTHTARFTFQQAERLAAVCVEPFTRDGDVAGVYRVERSPLLVSVPLPRRRGPVQLFQPIDVAKGDEIEVVLPAGAHQVVFYNEAAVRAMGEVTDVIALLRPKETLHAVVRQPCPIVMPTRLGYFGDDGVLVQIRKDDLTYLVEAVDAKEYFEADEEFAHRIDVGFVTIDQPLRLEVKNTTDQERYVEFGVMFMRVPS